MGYALLPRSSDGKSATIDLFVCIEEDDLDDIDLLGYAKRFMEEQIVPKWKNVKAVHLLEPSLSPPGELPCKRVRRVSEDDAD